MRTNAHILVYQTVFKGSQKFDLELDKIEEHDLIVESKEGEPKPVACLEWAIPSLLFVFLAKSYFEGFLNEAGSDHYKSLKHWLIGLNKKFKDKETFIVRATKSVDKVKNEKRPNNFFCIYLQTPKGNPVKIFIPKCDSDEENAKALSKLLDDFNSMYKYPNGKFAKKLNSLTNNNFDEIYAVFNKEKIEWEFLTMLILFEMSKRNN